MRRKKRTISPEVRQRLERDRQVIHRMLADRVGTSRTRWTHTFRPRVEALAQEAKTALYAKYGNR